MSPNDIHWKRYSQDLEPCLLRSSFQSRTRRQGWQSEEIKLVEDNQLQTFCSKNDLQASAVFLTAWSLTLRAYQGTEEVNFGYIPPADSHANKPQDDSTSPGLLGYRMRCVDKDTSQEVLSAAERNLQESLDHGDLYHSDNPQALSSLEGRLFNTVICLNQGSQHRRSGGPDREADSPVRSSSSSACDPGELIILRLIVRYLARYRRRKRYIVAQKVPIHSGSRVTHWSHLLQHTDTGCNGGTSYDGANQCHNGKG